MLHRLLIVEGATLAMNRKTIAILAIFWLGVPAAHASCNWQDETLTFGGTPVEQATCLLRRVEMGGRISAGPGRLPATLAAAIGTPTSIPVETLRQYAQTHGVSEQALGGAVNRPLSSTSGPRPKPAAYFVIHDTSTPLCNATSFPDNADASTARWNRGATWTSSPQAHLFITRDGASYSPQGRSFETPWRATRRESTAGARSRGRFLHIENVQLRRPALSPGQSATKPDGSCVNDRIAQSPGFTRAQLKRLALVYAAASVRAGHWLIPAFHAAVDETISGGHDDPQNFDLDAWAQEICALRTALGGNCGADVAPVLPLALVEQDADQALADQIAARLKSARYMEGSAAGACSAANPSGWEGFAVQDCRYEVRDRDGTRKPGRVFMLNPTALQLARWLRTSCSDAGYLADSQCISRLFSRVILQSGGQFVVAGAVWEDLYPPLGQHEAYAFRDGVTVRVPGHSNGAAGPLSDAQLQALLEAVPTATSTGAYARVAGTTRSQYQSAGGTSEVAGLAWLDVVRQQYQAAWGSDRNSLITAWLKSNPVR